MTNKQTGGPAFPNHTLEPNPNGGEPRIIWQEGMTLRDYFAAKAMQSLLTLEITADTIDRYERGMLGSPSISLTAYAVADAMLKAREE